MRSPPSLAEVLRAAWPGITTPGLVEDVANVLTLDREERAFSLAQYRARRARSLAESGWQETAVSEASGAVARALSALAARDPDG